MIAGVIAGVANRLMSPAKRCCTLSTSRSPSVRVRVEARGQVRRPAIIASSTASSGARNDTPAGTSDIAELRIRCNWPELECNAPLLNASRRHRCSWFGTKSR